MLFPKIPAKIKECRTFSRSLSAIHKSVIKNFFSAALLLFFITTCATSRASHIFGGELLYTHISGNTYKITLTVYGDCSASADIFNTLYASTPTIYVFNGKTTIPDTMFLNPEELGTEVSPVCPSQKNNTRCNGGSLPGVRKFVYSDNITLPVKSPDWAFVFTGEMNKTLTRAGRSGSITNIVNLSAGTSNVATLIDLEADLNNATDDNSSPVYSTIPTPFYCVNVVEQYNHGAIDPDGDSLAFSLVPAVDGNNGLVVDYIAPYTPTLPLATDSGAFSFNPLNGQITFTPNKTQDGLVVCQVSEYRKGVLIGTSEREMTFVVLNNCNGTPPNLSLENVSGGAITGKNIINICIGTQHLSFGINVANPDGDSLSVTNSSLPGSSTLSIANNNTARPSISFDWATASVVPGIYTFYLTVNNNHCPLASKQTVAYTINVTQVPVFSTRVLAPTQCVHQAYIEFDLHDGYTPRTLSVYQGTHLIKTDIDSTGVVTDSLPAGDFTIITSSDALCFTSGSLHVSDSGKLPLSAVLASYCIGEQEHAISIPPIGNNAVITWYDAAHNPVYFPPVPDTKVLNTTKWYFTEQYQYCLSDTTPVTAVVRPLPVPGAIIPETICLGDTVFLTGSGGVQYTWSPRTGILTDKNNKEYIRVLAPVNMQVVVTDQYGCTDSAIIAYKDVQYCCKFSYPDAFTPNGDGRNDGFRVIPYGILTQYQLMVFNRWGQKVFETTDQGQAWDGTFNGMPCDIGTYMYYFKGQCLTGNKEETRGDVILIR
jgi:gliding motility-associated-like protein